MKLTRAQKEVKLVKAAEEAIQQLLDWDEKQPRPNLTQIEEAVLAVRARLGQAMAEVVLAGQETQQPVAAPRCPTCGEPMRAKGRKGKALESRLGGLAMERGYYYCAHCERGLFPPGPTT
jgi:uncharacterized protein with PIN domain